MTTRRWARSCRVAVNTALGATLVHRRSTPLRPTSLHTERMKTSRVDAREGTILATAVNLANEAATGELVAALRAAGHRAIVLKGPPLQRWLYGKTTRLSQDVDILASWDRLAELEQVLASVGWRYLGIDAVGEDRPHCRIWQRRDNGLVLELHRNLAGIGVPAAEAWSIISAQTEEATVGATMAEVLAAPARAMHIALHAAQHGVAVARTLTDLERALELLPEEDWTHAADLAARLEATDAFSAGLGLVPKGQELLQTLGLPPPSSTEAVLRAQGSPLGADSLEWFTRLPDRRSKAKFLLRHLAPPRGYMCVWSGLARRGPLGLGLAYLWRPLWFLLHLGPAAASWRRARRTVRAPRQEGS